MAAEATSAADLQMVFQDSYSSLNPRLTIEETGRLRADGARRPGRRSQPAAARALLSRVGLARAASPAAIRMSCQAASASASTSRARWRFDPRLLILDEAVSALDKSVEAQVLNLLQISSANAA
jgi:peptide/nickel transport system ATP-binding protein